ncbi:MAG: helix-turn-helix domain-containing protein [Elusimicrobia bacterium]|nr:helix-turn-helix domain-containing protein [Elusimicrobiota bacterium]
MASPYVTVREAAQILGISEGKVMTLVQDKKLVSYRIADQYLRLKRTEVDAMKSSGDVVSENIRHPYTLQERIRDFFSYNDFYILSFVIILGLLAIVFFRR